MPPDNLVASAGSLVVSTLQSVFSSWASTIWADYAKSHHIELTSPPSGYLVSGLINREALKNDFK